MGSEYEKVLMTINSNLSTFSYEGTLATQVVALKLLQQVISFTLFLDTKKDMKVG